jgi:hypothetical protein
MTERWKEKEIGKYFPNKKNSKKEKIFVSAFFFYSSLAKE